MRVTWTRLNEPVVKHYTVHYSRVNGGSGRRRRQVGSETVIFPASASSGVVSGLQEGQQYQFSVSVTLLIGGQTYNGTPGKSETVVTGVLMLLHMTRFPCVQSVIVDSCTHKLIPPTTNGYYKAENISACMGHSSKRFATICCVSVFCLQTLHA